MQGNRGKTDNTNPVITTYRYQNQSKQVMKVRLSYYGTNKGELITELFLTIYRTS